MDATSPPAREEAADVEELDPGRQVLASTSWPTTRHMPGADDPQRTMPRYHLKLMFEWGGGTLWCVNDAALEAFDVGSIEEKLPFSAETLRRLEELSVWHDTSLDWDDPAGPGPWLPDEYERFDRAAAEILETIRAELGPDFSVEYRGL